VKIKFNWGTGIFIFIVIFVSTFITILIYSFSLQTNLESKDYYPKGVNYQQQIQKKQNANELTEIISAKKIGDKVIIQFPATTKNQKISGNIQFYYITDYLKDRNIRIEKDSTNSQTINVEKFVKGRYYIRIDWQNSEKKYYQEIEITL